MGGGYVPHNHRGESSPGGVPHYHGDFVRQLFIAGAAIMLLGAPFYTGTVRTLLPFLVCGALVLVALAALTNPHKRNIMMANSIVAGVGLLIYETWALFSYAQSTLIEFTLRQLIAFVFMGAFYFSMKTLRAMALGKIGKRPEIGEFDAPNDRA